MITRVPLFVKQRSTVEKTQKRKVFFRHMMDCHMNMDRLRRTITNKLIDAYMENPSKENETRLAKWGEKAVPKLYLAAIDWKNIKRTVRVLRILGKMDGSIAQTAFSLMSPDMDYDAYFILERKDCLPVLEKNKDRKKDADVTNLYIFSPDKGRNNIE